MNYDEKFNKGVMRKHNKTGIAKTKTFQNVDDENILFSLLSSLPLITAGELYLC